MLSAYFDKLLVGTVLDVEPYPATLSDVFLQCFSAERRLGPGIPKEVPRIPGTSRLSAEKHCRKTSESVAGYGSTSRTVPTRSLSTVSYTHLDVYKRQDKGRSDYT